MFETINRRPLLSASVNGVLAALAAKGAMKYGYKGLQSLTRGKLPDLKEGKRSELGNMLAAATGLGVGAYTLYDKGNMSSPRDFWDSIMDPEYWLKNPEKDLKEQSPHYGWYNPPENLEKEDSDFGFKNIPINFSMKLIDSDPYLDLPQKSVTNSIIFNAESKAAGHTSKNNLLSSATRAGLGFGSAYLLSSGLGSILSLPPKTAKQFSMAGGLAGAITNVLS